MEGIYETLRKKLNQWFCQPAKDVFPVYVLLASLSIYPFFYASQKADIKEVQVWLIDYRLLLLSGQVSGYFLGRFLNNFILKEIQNGDKGWIFLRLMGVVGFSLLLFTIVSAPLHFPFLLLNGWALGIIRSLIFHKLNGIKPVEAMSIGFSLSFIFLN